MLESKHFHFTGVCGTAMGAVAVAMKRKGFTVTGSDSNVYPPMSDFLRAEGIVISEGYRAENLPSEADVIVIGNAISRGNEEAEAALSRRLLYQSLPEVMKEHFLRGKRNYVVSGTHGKTTTSSMLAWLFLSAGRDPGWMIGGLPKNLGRGAQFGDSEFNVLEGDEYDTAFFDKRSKFLHYLPEVAVVNNIEFDHADIYASLDEIKLSFRRLLNVVPRNGLAIVNGDDPNCVDVSANAPCPVIKVGMGESNELRITDLCYEADRSSFNLGAVRYSLRMTGEFNVRNAAMAAAAASFAGLSAEEIREGLASFDGVARRQELRGEAGGVKVIDDFAHHPTAIRLAVGSLRQRYPEGRLWILFEPRSNTTRRAVFQTELADALALADQAVISEIPDLHKIPENDRLDPHRLAADIGRHGGCGRYIPQIDQIVDTVIAEAREGDVVAVLSNGGFGGIHGKLLDALERSTRDR
ncbi:MAG: UDP-N-acetylmuramate:L-alanyl-gamma-D-glutamyl-meso-diaminopimelate ligase [Verrucomicrobia bacterium]|nr:MAG: UDP-N-acetylmuramate:L-alanyl-gamma-D-glutamyl-meso-diaminopimelate ligase [Verrucomicrobiota bacterium]TAE89239.1 MAG: UDP-N-acetylmuramate:L-alanyl-gamma-D-glutamyl-meso-diaminopimelate ligase [Verrucomicrobiota bacterium]TAF27886.1 MAG: UDP-N-acetylmuramate:L-alanyl-gamma-D-glutamyl-meso-diaminopimelate ligase [Verrucomicrobiota bacterium]TAF42735.1 MAG: UDP-N-acetylmuramate:L-alanyl-gamma-D-glutamyl-meso-diaminopimelate ligase [Verrucomicrobiota bacterium]